MSSEKVYRFTSNFLGFTVWVGEKKVRFVRGIYETTSEKIAEALRKHKECTEVTKKAEPAEASAKPVVSGKPAKASKAKETKEPAEASVKENS